MAVNQAKIEKFEIEYEHHIYALHFNIGSPMRFNSGGKHWPVVTQCSFYIDGYLKATAEVIKHDNDENNLKFAKALVVKKLFKQLPYSSKTLRMKFWELIGHPDKDFKQSLTYKPSPYKSIQLGDKNHTLEWDNNKKVLTLDGGLTVSTLNAQEINNLKQFLNALKF